MNADIANLRQDYSSQSLLEDNVASHPLDQFGEWWQQAVQSAIVEPNAMTLATASADGLPAARIVLLKGFSKDGFVFFTNYTSYKGLQLSENPRACLLFFWKELERQVRITGLVSKVAEEESDRYFLSRPAGSQIGAWASPQSQAVPDRNWLDARYAEQTEMFRKKELVRPPFWGGYVVRPLIMEFWQGRPSRLHDRIQYSLQQDGEWKIERLAP